MLVFSKVLFPLKVLRLTVTFLGGRALAAAGPSLNISLPTLASFLWYDRRAIDLALTASLICFGRSLVILGSIAPTQPRQPLPRPLTQNGRLADAAPKPPDVPPSCFFSFSCSD